MKAPKPIVSKNKDIYKKQPINTIKNDNDNFLAITTTSTARKMP